MASEQKRTRDIVTFLNTKTQSGYDYYPIGTDIRYITNKRNKSANNLEEDMILGVNRVIEIENDDEAQAVKKTIKYCTPDKVDLGGYYELVMLLYGSQSGDSTVDINFDNEDLLFTVFGSDGSVYFPKAVPSIQGTTIDFMSQDNFYGNTETNTFDQYRSPDNMTYNSDTNKLTFLPRYTSEETVLYYRVDQNNTIPLQSKKVEKQFDNNGKQYIQEVISEIGNNNG